MRFLNQVELGVDEFESIRLADFEGLSQEEAAPHMNVSPLRLFSWHYGIVAKPIFVYYSLLILQGYMV